MAESLQLVSRSAAVGLRSINGVQAVLINADSAAAASVVIAAAVAQCNARYAVGGNPTFDTNYFDTVTAVGDLTSGPLKDASDAYLFLNDSAPVKVEG